MRTLLLADESVTVQRVISLTFAEQDIQIVSVSDGRQAMEHMASQRPDIVLAGTSLPQVSGYDLARYMRGSADLKDVPVLLLSGAFETVDEARLKESGANGILEKPVEPTVVIGRVKELLGLKSEDKPAAPAGRLLTPTTPPQARASAPPPPSLTDPHAPSKWDQLRRDTGLEPDARSFEDASSRAQGYGQTLDAAFDSLDQQLASPIPSTGNGPKTGSGAGHKAPRNPAGPIGAGTAGFEPRPTAKAPSLGEQSGNNPVYEVDDDWFGDQESKARADVKAGRRPSGENPAAAATDAPVYEVDEDWFREQDRARMARTAEREQLAAEMGIRDIDLTPVTSPKPDERPSPPPVAAVPSPQPSTPSVIAPMPPAEIKVVTPEITPAMLDQIAGRVAERLSASAFGDQLRQAMTAVMRETIDKTIGDTVRPIVSETSERVVREVVAETSERVVREVVTGIADRAVRDAVSQSVERALPDVVAQTTERVVRDVVPATAERVVREVVAETSDRAVREVISETSERLVREEIERIKSRSKSHL